MSKLLCMVGLPGAGKSTRAAELLVEYGNAVRINRDSLREMLHLGLPWSGKKERITKDVARTLAKHLLTGDKAGVVLIDDCNLDVGTLESWRALAQECGATFEIVRLDTPVEECLRRDVLRKKRVGRHVIIGMAMQFGLYPRPKKGFVIVDIDGTMADITHRLHYVKQEPKDWGGFFRAMSDDSPRTEIVEMVRALKLLGHQIIFVSGRPDTYRAQTEAWLSQVFPHYTTLFMRRGDDHRPDAVVKEEILKTYFFDTSTIHTVFDDRPRLVSMWRSHGLDVVDVGDGTDF